MTHLRKIVNVFLALLLLLSTMGVTMHKHYCMGRLKNVAFFHQAESCQNEMDMNSVMDCCNDTEEEFKVENLTKVVHEFDFSLNPGFTAVITYLLIDFDLRSSSITKALYQNYKPPLIDYDINILVQSFLL